MAANKYYCCNDIYDAITDEHIPPEQVEYEKSDEYKKSKEFLEKRGGKERTYTLRNRTKGTLLRSPKQGMKDLLSGTNIRIESIDERYLPALNSALSNSKIDINVLHIQAENACSDFVKFECKYTHDQLWYHGQPGKYYDAECYGTITENEELDLNQYITLPNQPDNGNKFLICSYTIYFKLGDTINGNDFNIPLECSLMNVVDKKSPKPPKIIFNCSAKFNEEYCKNHGDFWYAVAIHYLE